MNIKFYEKCNLLNCLSSYISIIFSYIFLPSQLMKNIIRDKIQKYYNNIFHKIIFFRSGRSALTALLLSLFDDRNNKILLPDYICNVVYQAADFAGFEILKYRTNNKFKPDIKDIEKKIKENNINIILFSSIFGQQNNSKNLVKSIRNINKNIYIIFDESQNLITKNDLKKYKNTFVLFSFNDKTVPGTLGGALAFFNDNSNILQSVIRHRKKSSSFSLENFRILAMFIKKMISDLKKNFHYIFRLEYNYKKVSYEFSNSQNQYKVEPFPIAKISLAQTFIHLFNIKKIEKTRLDNYKLINSFLQEAIDEDILIKTSKVEYSPLIPIDFINLLNGEIPLKGYYTDNADGYINNFSQLKVSIKNTGFFRFIIY